LSSWKILSCAALCLLQDRLPYEATWNAGRVLSQVDLACILKTWRIKGVLVCPWRGKLRPCLWVENAYPCGILEVVRQPLRSHMAGFPPLPLRRTSSSHNEDRLQFAEARVFTFVPPLVQDLEIPIAAPRGPLLQFNYVSELDAAGWRTGLLDLLVRPLPEGAGAWGGYVPRTGFVVQQSEVLAAHLQAVRAGRVAFEPAGRLVPVPYRFEPRTGHFIQMVSPVRRGCVSIGHPDLRAIERGALSPHGAYLFVHFGLFEECRRCLEPRLVGPRSP
jgi:hypothetical protein